MGEELYVTGDPGKLKRLVDVLLDNARKYAAPGSRIKVTLVPEGSKRGAPVGEQSGRPHPG